LQEDSFSYIFRRSGTVVKSTGMGEENATKKSLTDRAADDQSGQSLEGTGSRWVALFGSQISKRKTYTALLLLTVHDVKC